jgi:Trypsin-like peptidase domain
MRYVATFIAIMAVVFATSAARAESAQQVAKATFPSTVLLVMEDANGQPLSLGSGFFVTADEVATNVHVIRGATTGYAKIIGLRKKYDVVGIVAIDTKHDLAILKVRGIHRKPLRIISSATAQIGQTVYAVGNPEGLEGTFSEGIVSSIRTFGDEKVLQITAPISPGSSGGPVLDHEGGVVGVSVATYRGGQNLNFAVPSDYLIALLKKGGPITPLRTVRQIKGAHSIVSNAGGHGPASVTAGYFAWTSNQFEGYYTFSVRNKLRESIRDVVCLVIFYARDGQPIDTEFVTIRGPIDGHLARRSPQSGRLDADQVRNLTTKVAIRVLDFKIGD